MLHAFSMRVYGTTSFLTSISIFIAIGDYATSVSPSAVSLIIVNGILAAVDSAI